MNLPVPLQGVSDLLASSDQVPNTSRDMQNMRPEDPTNGRLRLSQRSGLSPYMTGTLQSAAAVRALDQVTYQLKTVDYEPKIAPAGIFEELVNADDRWSSATPSKLSVAALTTDRQGNVYATDGLAGVVKFNSAGEQQWKVALANAHPQAVVRALGVATVGFVGSDGDAIFAGVSAGGPQSEARMWGYKQVSTTTATGTVQVKTEKVWELQPGAFVEKIKLRDGFIYTAQNEPDVGKSFMRIYSGVATAQPDLALEWEIPYPCNDCDVKLDDGAVLTAHEPNSTRGRNPQAPGFTARDLAREWTLKDLTDLDKRLWLDLDAATLGSSLGVVDGDVITAWPDDGPGFRPIFQTGAAVSQPTYVESGIGGLPAVRFSGAVAGLTPNLVSGPNPTTTASYDDQQKTTVPAYDGNRWVMFIVMRPATEPPATAVIRPAFRRDNEAAGALAAADTLCVNKDSTTAVATTGTFAGKVAWLTQTDTTNGPGAGTASSTPFAGDWLYGDSTGACIITICHDGNANATTDQAQHSFFRINGRPTDRWTSLADIGLSASTVGGPGNGALTTYLQADVGRIIVLRDYTDGGTHGNPITGALTTGGGAGNYHYPRTLGTMAASTAISEENLAGNRYNDNEIERIEGMLAGEWGLSHLLPCGTAAVLTFSAVPNDADTVTIGGVVFTFKTALTGSVTNYEVLRGATSVVAGSNLLRCINQTGTYGTDYCGPATPHTTAIATLINNETAAAAKLKIETKGLTAIAVAESTAGARMAWNVATTTTLATVTGTTGAYMPGHYRHPFNINHGYPRKDSGSTVGVLLESKGKMLASTQGILARWNANGSIAWVLTSRAAVATPAATLPATNQYFGGIGYACAFGIDTGVYSYGPKDTLSASTQNELAILRRCVDNATTVTAPATATGLGTGTFALPSSLLVGTGAAENIDYKYPRIAVDTFDNVVVPYYELDSGTKNTAVCVGQPGNVAGIVLWNYEYTTGGQTLGGLCVAIDPKLPDYQEDPCEIAFAVYVGTNLGHTADIAGAPTIHKVEAATATNNGSSPRATKYVGVCNGYVRTFTTAGPLDPGGTATLVNPQLSATAQFFASTVAYGEVFLTDGRTDLAYKAQSDVLSKWASTTAGEMKPRARLLCTWHGRIVRARFADDPHEWMMSAVGAPRDWDINPPVMLRTQAVLGSQAPGGIGKCPDIVNALIPYSDDLLIFLCQSSVWRMDGDPMDGGRMSLVSDTTGGSFGNSWCKDENGVVYFHGSRGGVYRLVPGKLPDDISEGAIPNRLRTIDLQANRVELRWNDVDSGLHVWTIPYDSADADATTEHYFWSRKVQGWFPDTLGLEALQPTSTLTIDGDASSNRRMILGGTDGQIRVWDATALDDDGTAIDAHVLIGPLRPKQDEFETRFTRLQVVLGQPGSGAAYSFYATDSPDVLGDAVYTGTLRAGRNYNEPVRALGSYVALELSNGAPDQRFSIENIEVDAVSAGRKRVRS